MGYAELKFKNKAAEKFLSDIGKNVDDIADRKNEFWGALTSVALKDVVKHFENEEGPTGKWEKWSDLYAKHMARIGKDGNKILQDNGRMRQSLFRASEKSRIKQGQLLYNPAKTDNGYPYAKGHDEGSKKLPQRQFMYLSGPAAELLAKITAAYTTKKR